MSAFAVLPQEGSDLQLTVKDDPAKSKLVKRTGILFELRFTPRLDL
jgi:hypothetical protein